MDKQEYHQLPPDRQEELRRQAVQAIIDGRKQIEVARLFGVTRQAVNNWMTAYREGGLDAIKARRRGRPRGSGKKT